MGNCFLTAQQTAYNDLAGKRNEGFAPLTGPLFLTPCGVVERGRLGQAPRSVPGLLSKKRPGSLVAGLALVNPV